MFKSSFSVELNMPAEKADLAGWLYGLSSSQYRSCGKGHLAMGHTSGAGGGVILINVEYVCLTLMTHHYEKVCAERQRVKVSSPHSRGYLFGFVPVLFSVSWEMAVTPVTADKSKFTCNIEVTLLSKRWIEPLAGRLIALLLDRHNREEAPNFARSIEGWRAPSGGV